MRIQLVNALIMLESYLSWIDDVRNDTKMEKGFKVFCIDN